MQLSESEINRILNSLGFEIKNSIAVVPKWRKDVGIWQDLAEEVGRIYGYDKIIPIPLSKTEPKKKSDFFKKEWIKDLLVALGFVEVSNYAFLSQTDIEAAQLKPKDLLEVANPLQLENKYLRNSLIPKLLSNVAKNPTFDPVLLFEVGKVFDKENEKLSLGVVSSGKNSFDFIDKAANQLANSLKIKRSEIEISELKREDLQRFKIKKPLVYAFQIDLSPSLAKLKIADRELELRISDKKIHYRPISKYPSIVRDIAFIVDRSIGAEDIADEIYTVSNEINRVELFDEYVSDKIGMNKKSLAYHLYLESMDRTLTDQEAESIMKKIIKKIENKFSATLRS